MKILLSSTRHHNSSVTIRRLFSPAEAQMRLRGRDSAGIALAEGLLTLSKKDSGGYRVAVRAATAAAASAKSSAEEA